MTLQLFKRTETKRERIRRRILGYTPLTRQDRQNAVAAAQRIVTGRRF